MTDAQIEAAIFLTIAASIWGGALFLMARFSPWHKISQSIPPHLVPQAFGGEQQKKRFVSARIASDKFKNCLTVTFNRHGFGVKVFPLLIPGHPKLFIPWESIDTLTNENFLFMPATRITLKNNANLEILFYGTLFQDNAYVPSHLQTSTSQ